MPGPGLAGRQAEPFCRSGTGGSNPVRSSGQSRLSREFAFLGREAGGFPVVNTIGIVWVAKILTDLTPNDMARASSGISAIESRVGGRARQIENRLAPTDAEDGRAAMRHLTVMVGVGAGDRQPNPAALAETPGGRQEHDHDFFRASRNERGRIAAIAAVVRPGRVDCSAGAACPRASGGTDRDRERHRIA